MRYIANFLLSILQSIIAITVALAILFAPMALIIKYAMNYSPPMQEVVDYYKMRYNYDCVNGPDAKREVAEKKRNEIQHKKEVEHANKYRSIGE